MPAWRAPLAMEAPMLVASGMRRSEIAAKIGISVNTVATLLARAYRKLDVRSRKSLRQRLARSW
jgi:DNA-binding CsgD family transcriptional regulator